MARFLTVNKKNSRSGRKHSLKGFFRTGPFALGVAMILLFCFLSLFFLAQVFQSSTRGYEVSALEKKVKRIKEDNQKLEVRAAELQSLDKIEESVKTINMVPIEEVIYVKSDQNAVAAARR